MTTIEEIEASLICERHRIEAALAEQERIKQLRAKLELNYVQSKPETIALQVANEFQVPFRELMGRRRPEWIAFPRQVAMALVYEITDMKLKAVGEFFGGRDHGTVLHAVNAVRNREETCPATKRRIDSIRAMYAAPSN